MNMTLDHFFILVEPEAKVADRLLEHGFQEGPRNTHPGQGTANRRFYFANGMLEFIWVKDADEARNGPGRKLHFSERAEDPTSSPFGIIFAPCDNTSPNMPFPGWKYQPDYFPPSRGFHVGANSHNIAEPLCFYFPFHDPGVPKPQPNRNLQTVSEVIISTTSTDTEGVLELASQADCLSILRAGKEHLMDITLDHHNLGRTEDYRPALPLILRW